MKNQTLCQALEKFEIDVGRPQLAFATRLARENRWTPGYADRVVREYKRFVYLACVSENPVTPSVEIDQAWHLHLCYTRSYWQDMCEALLGRPLHHGPTRGGKAEDEKYHDWYRRTLALYQEEFGRPPPADIWPPADERFSPRHMPRSVTRHRFIVIEKRPLATACRVLGLACAGVAGAGALATGSHISAWIFALFLVGVLVLIWKALGKGKDKDGGSSCGSSCSSDGGSGCGGGGCGGD